MPIFKKQSKKFILEQKLKNEGKNQSEILEEQIKGIIKVNEELKNKNKTLEEEIQSKENLLLNLDDKIDDLNKELEDKDNQYYETKNLVEKETEKKNILFKKNAIFKNSNKELEEIIKKLELYNEKMKQKIRELRKEENCREFELDLR